METRYKVILSNKLTYKEIEIPEDISLFRVGTEMGADYRLYREDFFGPIELVFSKSEGLWNVRCSDSLYFNMGDVRRLMYTELHHGYNIGVKYKDSEGDALNIEFLIDFDDGSRKYERIIDFGNNSVITIGSAPSSNICIQSAYTAKENIKLHNKGSSYVLEIKETQFGIYHDGKFAEDGEIINNGDFLQISDFFFYLEGNSLYGEIRPDLIVHNLSYKDKPNPNNYPRFNRNTRVRKKIAEEKIEVLDPPNKPEKPKNNIFMRLLPSIGMLIAAGIMAMMGGSRMIIFSGISGGIAIFTSIMGIKEANKEYKEKTEQRIEKYNTYISKKRIEVSESRAEELKDLNEIYISYDKEKERFDSFSPDLFDRVPEDEDYLCVRLGYGDRKSIKQIDYKKQERLEIEDNLQEMPAILHDEFEYINSAPIVCNLSETNAIGVVGNEDQRFELLKIMVIDIVARHHFSNVETVFVAEKKNKDRVKWLRFLPYSNNEISGVRNIVCDDESKNLVFESLYRELSNREQSKEHKTNIVMFLYDEYGFMNHPISQFVEKAKDLGVTFVFFGESKAEIPIGCGYIVEVRGQQYAELINTEDDSESAEFYYQAIADEQAESIAKMIAPIYSEEVSLEGSLIKNISLFELLNIIAVDDINLAGRWSSSRADKSMAAPLGVSTSGVISLDLHDKAHGPHGLVAGTTGSGKSEILQTYILAMATLYHPYEVGFVIIDFKGGGMANQFRDLPHLMGAITNIDGKAINRSLKSIKAELQKRQRLFSEVDVNHIDKYIQKYKSGEAKTPLPHLIIIVDEFAELKAEQPDFMKELISAARIGRSLGVHLILATQKPSGQVNEQIWSNSRFKLCLKVQDSSDSNEVLKSPLAAEIKEPGRAYLQVGNNEIFELFQSAYSGAPERVDNANVKEFTIYEITESGKRVPTFVQKKSSGNVEGSRTQLDAIVQYVNRYCKDTHIVELPDICLPTLPEVIDYVDEALPESEIIRTNIGVYDDPDNQYQGTYSIDITGQNTMIIGSSQSGKTNLLQVIIRDLATRYTPAEVNFYIIDFASMVLRNFDALKHVGGVVTSSEDEKLKNLFKLLFAEIELRKEKLLSVGVSSFVAYKEAGKTDLPQIVLMIDNLTALKEMYFEDDDDLLRLCREGLSVGISVIIANPQTSGIGYRYLSNFGNRIALFCNDSGEYGSLFDHCREVLEDIHGRCLVEVEKTHLECQGYLSFVGIKEIDRVSTIKQWVNLINQRNQELIARRIPEVPSILTEEYIESNYPLECKAYSIPIGMDYSLVAPLLIDFSALESPLVLSGGKIECQVEFVLKSIERLHRNSKNKIKLYVIDGIGNNLEAISLMDYTEKYTVTYIDSDSIMREIHKTLEERYDKLTCGDLHSLENEPLIVLLINNRDALRYISENMELYEMYQEITGRYKNVNICAIIVDYANVNVNYSSPNIVRDARDAAHFLFLDNLSAMKIIDFPLSIIRTYKKRIMRDEAFYISGEEIIKIKLIN